jgi:hypothetical protein
MSEKKHDAVTKNIPTSESTERVELFTTGTSAQAPTNSKRRPFWFSPRWVAAIGPMIVAIAGLLGAGVGVILQGYANTQLERQKFESALIQKALENPKKVEAAKNLKFLVDTGIIQNLDKAKISELAKTPDNLPSGLEVKEQGLPFRPLTTPVLEGNRCRNPPLTATLNYWPVTYSDPRETCQDHPSIDARLLPDGTYSRSQDEWEAGRNVHVGDEFFVLIWINNGAADTRRAVGDQAVAKNVRLLTYIGGENAPVHYIYAQFAGDNTNIVTNRFKIQTPENAHLIVIPSSGEIYDETGKQPIQTNLDIGNNTVLVGNFEPYFEAGRYIRFQVRVAN